jgi:hypothetical protein
MPCTEAFATRLAGLATMRGNAQGIYGAPYGGGVLLLAVLAPAVADPEVRS